jgi:PhnB protein
MMKLTPYLLFDGACGEAMQFYHEQLGGELSMTRVAESVLKDHTPPSLHNKVLNARLMGIGIDFSASDWMLPDQKPVSGNTLCMYFSGGDRDELKHVFESLSDGADVTDPLKEMPFLYGALNDRFGVRWMFHAN